MKKILILLVLATMGLKSFGQNPELIVPFFHSAVISTLEISPNGKYMVSGGGDQVLKIWNVQRAKEIKNISTDEDIVSAVFSPDGKYVAATDKKHLYLVELTTMKLLHKWKFPYRALVYGIDFGKNSRSIYFGFSNEKNKQIEIHKTNLDGGNDQLIFNRTVASTYENINALSVSSDENYLLFTGHKIDDGILNLKNTQEIKPAPKGAQFFLPNNSILTFNPDQKNNLKAIIPSSGATLWSKNFKKISKSSAHWTHEKFLIDPTRQQLSFSQINGNNKLLLSIDINSGKAEEFRQFSNDGKPNQLARWGDDFLILTEDPKSMKIVDGKTKEVRKSFGEPIMKASFMDGNPELSSIVVSSFYNKKVKHIDFDEGKMKINTLPTVNGIDLLRMSKDGNVVASVNSYDLNKPIQVFSNGKLIQKIPGRTKAKKLLDIAVSGDGTRLAIMFFEQIKVVDVNSGNTIYTEDMKDEFYKYSGGKLIFSDKDKLWMSFESKNPNSSGDKKTVRCYSINAKKMLWAKQADYQHIKFKDEQTIYATEYKTKKFHIIDASTGNIQSSKSISDLKFTSRKSSYNQYSNELAIEDDFDIIIYDIKNGNKKGVLKGATAQVSGLSYYQQDFLFSCGRDNVIRLWDTQTMKMLAQIIVYAETKEWVIVTPDGRFDGSESAIQKMYYVQGQETIPLDQLFEQFYTPNLLSQLLYREIVPAPVEIEEILPPPSVLMKYKAGQRNLVVEDDEPNDVISTTKEEATIEVVARTVKGDIDEIRLYHNGKIVGGGSRGLVVEDEKQGEKEQNFQIKLTSGENIFRAVALNNQRTESAPTLLKINYTPNQQSSQNVTSSTGMKLHLVVVGINEYKNRKYNLNYAIADAEAFKNKINESMKEITTKVNTYFVSNDKANKSGILAVLQKVKENANSQDILIFYYAGHGVMSEGMNGKKKDFYFVPHDVTQLYGNDGALAEKGISATEMQELSAAIPAQKQLFILDACQSAGAVETIAMRGAAEEKAIAQLARSTGTHWLTASGSEQYATEFAQLGHGVFTYALLEGLKGKADNGDKKITVNELKAWLESEVPELTQKYKGTPQYPASYGYGQDFPIGTIQ